MALLVAITPGVAAQAEAAALSQQALASARMQGHGDPVLLTWTGGQAMWFDTPGNAGAAGACLVEGSRFAAYVGTVHWRGLTRSALLRRLLEAGPDPASLPLRELAGSYTMLIGDAHRAWLFNDAVGLHKTYARSDRRLYSTSLLLCRSTLQRPRLNRLRAQEFVLLGANHANETPLADIEVCDPTLALELGTGSGVAVHRPEDWRQATPPATFDQAVEQVASSLLDDGRSMVSAFGSKIGMALSGGFDSRLILAVLDSLEVRPALYVYGREGDADVQIASAKAADLGLAIRCIDKSVLNAGQPAFDAAGLRASLGFFDGLPTDGVFDRGADRLTRLLQVEGGTLNLNGGGGEILRNFFYIRDRAYTADELVGVFYSNWVPQAVPSPEDRLALRAALGSGILACLGFDSNAAATTARRLSRSDVELVYSLYRLRYWMGRNNSVASRYGDFLTPLPHPGLVSLAARIPIRWKTYGQLESAVINRLSPRVADGPSDYGFSFASGPHLAHRMRLAGTLVRPVALRRASTAIRHALGRSAQARAPAEWTAALPDAEVDWIDVRYLSDTAQLNRLMTLRALLSPSFDPVAAA
ncbi:Asparagine synthase [Rubrivivax sp. A210]|uniref:hypothetical protein n=1 Tax=Rubrivivax sp. A210 TaxID=2772301 RepID=UPI00191965B8|nr:hypothetical protein [Rubrivivax sp. A210]CAD5375234.1 Asparagine synthase [Rubrivivax sp. A210]